MKEFGSRLRKLRRDAEMTQRQLGKAIGVTGAAVVKYERIPNAYPSVEILVKIADYFHVSTDYLLRGITQNPPTENNVSGDLTNSTVIQANRGSAVFNDEQVVSLEAKDVLYIYDKLGVRERLKLLNFAVDLEERNKVRTESE